VHSSCKNNCVYARDGKPGSKYCFADGKEEVQPLDGQCTPGAINVTSVTPDKGSVHGGQVIHIYGNGFSTSPGATTVTIGGANCPLKSNVTTSKGPIICTTPPGPPLDAPLVVTSCTANAPITNYTYSDHLTPNIAHISPPSYSGPVKITLTGSNFGLTPAATTVTATSGINQSAIFKCIVSTSTAQKITCNLPSLSPTGHYTVIVNNANFGLSNKVAFTEHHHSTTPPVHH
jgi:hypothetical protein